MLHFGYSKFILKEFFGLLLEQSTRLVFVVQRIIRKSLFSAIFFLYFLEKISRIDFKKSFRSFFVFFGNRWKILGCVTMNYELCLRKYFAIPKFLDIMSSIIWDKNGSFKNGKAEDEQRILKLSFPNRSLFKCNLNALEILKYGMY